MCSHYHFAYKETVLKSYKGCKASRKEGHLPRSMCIWITCFYYYALCCDDLALAVIGYELGNFFDDHWMG